MPPGLFETVGFRWIIFSNRLRMCGEAARFPAINGSVGSHLPPSYAVGFSSYSLPVVPPVDISD
ncbi:MAG: hypothetical protein LBQ54_09075 [Planctomycetaceae bacterium]|nr:hypothetical protein [Planctomycetaceae bacterium]